MQDLAQHRRTHPAHGFAILRVLVGSVQAALKRYSDDPAIAACQLLDEVAKWKGYCTELERWATAVNACDPADMNSHGARLDT